MKDQCTNYCLAMYVKKYLFKTIGNEDLKTHVWSKKKQGWAAALVALVSEDIFSPTPKNS
jgi:hypothetical protein